MFKKYKQLIVGVVLGAFLFNGVPTMALSGLRNISVKYDNIRITLNGKEVKADAEPFIYNGSTYVPLRFVSETLGASVNWHDNLKTIDILSQSNGGAKEPSTTKPVEPQGSVSIVKSGFHTNGAHTFYSVLFSDDFAVILNTDKGQFPNLYNHITIGIKANGADMKDKLKTPSIVGFDELLGDKHYPKSFGIYSQGMPAQFASDFKTTDFYNAFERGDLKEGITGAIVYDKFTFVDGVQYDDGIHKCTLYFEDKIR